MCATKRWLAIAVCLGAFAAGWNAAATAAQKNETTQATDTESGGYYVCPRGPYAFYPDYWSYWAIRCDTGESVSLDAEPGLEYSECPPTGGEYPEDCVQILSSSYLKKEKSKEKKQKHVNQAVQIAPGYFVQTMKKDGTPGIGTTGFKKELPETHKPPHTAIAKSEDTFLVWVQYGTNKKFRAKLIRFAVDPSKSKQPIAAKSKLPTKDFRIGFEVQSGTPLHTIGKDNVSKVPGANYCYRVKFGNKVYRVFVHKSHADK